MRKDPWNFSEVESGVLCEDCSCPSPNGEFILEYSEIKQIVNNYPLTGNCYFISQDDKVLLHIDAGGPPVWSKDSMFFALPVWLYNENGYVQRIGFGSVKDKTFMISTDFFKVMQIEAVNKNTIEIIEDPVKKDQNNILKVNELDFYETIHLPNLIGVLQ